MMGMKAGGVISRQRTAQDTTPAEGFATREYPVDQGPVLSSHFTEVEQPGQPLENIYGLDCDSEEQSIEASLVPGKLLRGIPTIWLTLRVREAPRNAF